MHPGRHHKSTHATTLGGILSHQAMDVDEGWKLKSNMKKGASSPTALDRFGHAMSPTSQVKSFK